MSTNYLNKLYDTLVANPTLRRATAFVDPKRTIKLTRQRRRKGRVTSETYLLTDGVPNFVERGLIKTMVKAGTKFPFPKLKLQEWPAAKSKAKKAAKGKK